MVTVAQYGLLIILSAILVFHICIVFKLIPYSIVWGGRLKTDKDMYRFEIVSILVNTIFLAVILIQAEIWSPNISKTVITVGLWVMAALFLLNTFGNLASKNRFEKLFFTPLTIILCAFSLILALNT